MDDTTNRCIIYIYKSSTSQWRHNGHDSVSNQQLHDCLLNRLFRRRSKKTSKLRVTGLCARNSPETGEFPAQMASNADFFFHLMTSSWRSHHQTWTSHCIDRTAPNMATCQVLLSVLTLRCPWHFGWLNAFDSSHSHDTHLYSIHRCQIGTLAKTFRGTFN